jgi:uncharacterized protein
MSDLYLPGLPGFDWEHELGEATIQDGVLRMTASARTDWVSDQANGDLQLSAPALGFTAPVLYTLAARVRPTFAGTFDAGVLIVYQDERTWAKLCFEYSPQRQPMVVSVVTRGVSDDCNSVAVDQDWVDLRISRNGQVFAFHYSLGGQRWHFVRLFALGEASQVMRTGFLTQSPMGEGAQTEFSRIAFSEQPLTDYRSGV